MLIPPPPEPHLNTNAQSYNSSVMKLKAWIFTCEDILGNDNNYYTKNVSALFFQKTEWFLIDLDFHKTQPQSRPV